MAAKAQGRDASCVCILLPDGSLRLFENPPVSARAVLEMYQDFDLVPHTASDNPIAKKCLHPDQLLWPDLTYQLVRRQTFIYRGLGGGTPRWTPSPQGGSGPCGSTPPLSRSSTGPRSPLSHTPPLSRTSTGSRSPLSPALSHLSLRSPLSQASHGFDMPASAGTSHPKLLPCSADNDNGFDFQAGFGLKSFEQHLPLSAAALQRRSLADVSAAAAERDAQMAVLLTGAQQQQQQQAPAEGSFRTGFPTLGPPPLQMPEGVAARRRSLASAIAAERDAQLAILQACQAQQRQIQSLQQHQQQQQQQPCQYYLADQQQHRACHWQKLDPVLEPAHVAWRRRSLADTANVERDVQVARQQARMAQPDTGGSAGVERGEVSEGCASLVEQSWRDVAAPEWCAPAQDGQQQIKMALRYPAVREHPAPSTQHPEEQAQQRFKMALTYPAQVPSRRRSIADAPRSRLGARAAGSESTISLGSSILPSASRLCRTSTGNAHATSDLSRAPGRASKSIPSGRRLKAVMREGNALVEAGGAVEEEEEEEWDSYLSMLPPAGFELGPDGRFKECQSKQGVDGKGAEVKGAKGHWSSRRSMTVQDGKAKGGVRGMLMQISRLGRRRSMEIVADEKTAR